MLASVILAVSLFSSVSAFAGADDVKWINQCKADNKGEKGYTEEIGTKYCTCMNSKMGDNETRTITEWEKANPKSRAACEKEAGWH